MKNIDEKISIIAQNYLGAIPSDKGCKNWSEMQAKMVDELKAAIGDQSDELYYIQHGYVGNAILWWNNGSKGYTAHFKHAEKFTKKAAMKIINDKPDKDDAWLCSHVDDTKDAHVLTIEIGNLDIDFRITGKSKN